MSTRVKTQEQKDRYKVRRKIYTAENREKINLQRAEYNLKNEEKIREYNLNYQKTNAEDIIKKRKAKQHLINAQSNEYFKTLPGRFNSYKANAKARGIYFELTKEDFSLFWQKPCIYCGSPVDTIGLDRIDNSKGYILDNVQSCCSMCNYAKRDRSVADFILHANKIANYYKGEF